MRIAYRLGQTFTPDGDLAVYGEGIDRLNPHPVETNGLLEGFRVDLPPCIHLARGVDELTQGDTSPVVTDRHFSFMDRDLDLLASTHDILVDGVVEYFFEQDIYTVVSMGTITELTDVHPRATADMFIPF